MAYSVFRRVFYELHLWLGILSGVILFVVCLTGTILVFRDEVQRMAEPAKYFVTVPENASPLSPDDLIAKLEAAKPGMKVSSITIPEQANRTVIMNLASPGQAGGGRGHGGPGMETRQGGRPQRGELLAEGERDGRGDVAEGRRPQRGKRPEGERTAAQVPERVTVATPGGPQGGPGGVGRGRNMVYVNPYTGEITGEGESSVTPFFRSVQQLHRFLWLPPKYGKPIVGYATIIFIVLCVSGIVLWLPKTLKAFTMWKGWKPGLRIRVRKGVWPFAYDIHNSIGFYLLVPCLLLALTGLCWSFSWYRDGASALLGDEIFKGRRQRPATIEHVTEPGDPLSVSKMIALQSELTPGRGEISVSIPQDKETAMIIQKGGTGFFDLAIKDKTQWDRFQGTPIPVEHHGKMVEVERFSDKPLGAQIAASVRGVHFGNITGMSSKILFFIACLFATTFPVTGVALWAKKLASKYKKRHAVKEEARSETVRSASQLKVVEGTSTEEKPTNVGQAS